MNDFEKIGKKMSMTKWIGGATASSNLATHTNAEVVQAPLDEGNGMKIVSYQAFVGIR